MVNEYQRRLQQMREDMRWRLLEVASFAGATGLTDSIAFPILHELFPYATLRGVQDELDYLEGKGLIDLQRGGADWRYSLSATGTDCVQGNIECPAGIRKPII